MAAYIDLYNVRSNTELRNTIAIAVVVAAQEKLAGTPSAVEAKWAVGVVRNPNGTAAAVINLVLAANKGLTIETILAAGDPAIQANVDACIDGLILGEG